MTDYIVRAEQNILESSPELEPYFRDISGVTATNAFSNTSHFPERRGASIRAEYSSTLMHDRDQVTGEVAAARARGADIAPGHEHIIQNWFVSHRAGLTSAYNAYLHSHASVASSFICGPANFPVARNRKRMESADNKYAAINEFRQRSIKRVLRALMPFGDGTRITSDDPGATRKIDAKVAAMEKQREQMKTVNRIIRKYYPKGDPAGVTDAQRAECVKALIAETGCSECEAQHFLKPNYMRRVVGYEHFELSNLGANIRRLKERVGSVERVQSLTIDDDFDNGVTVEVSADSKICINFGFKPDEETRRLMKSRAFKWSRQRGMWVRKLTDGAYSAYNEDIRPVLEKL